MRIAIDGCCWSNRRGFGRYTREMVTHLVGLGSRHEFVLVVDEQTARTGAFPAKAQLRIVRTSEQPSEAASADGARRPMDLWRLGRAMAGVCPDVMFFPAVYSYYPVLSRVPAVVAFHDAIAEKHPQLIFPTRRARMFWSIKTHLALRQASRVLTVSNSARRQIVEEFRCPASRIDVITEGYGCEFRVLDDPTAGADVRLRFGLPTEAPLILYVGGISPHKNLLGLVAALDVVRQEEVGDWYMVFAGDYQHDSFFSCYQELLALCRERGLEERVRFTGYLENQDLVALYNTATLLVLPSFAEGFGLPVLEAMACGLPVAASDRGSLPEVMGSAGLLFDPTDTRAMASAVRRLLEDAALREQMRSAGLERARCFSWERAAEQLLALLERVAGAA